MYVRMLDTIASATDMYETGEVYEVADAIGAAWTRSRLATLSLTPPRFLAEFLARMDEGAGETCLFLPYLGEFGHMVMTWLRLVHWHKAKKKIVCCRKGEEVLYPSADKFFTDWTHPVPDAERCQAGFSRSWPAIEAKFPKALPILSGSMTMKQLRTPIQPGERIPFRPKARGLKVDVCIGTRFRAIGAERNWPHWQTVADALTAAGHSIAVIGVRPTAPDLTGATYHSGDYDTAAAIELMQGCRLYLGTDSGNTHLAALTGANVKLIKGHRGDGYLPMMQHVNSEVELIEDGWGNPQAVIASALSALAGVK